MKKNDVKEWRHAKPEPQSFRILVDRMTTRGLRTRGEKDFAITVTTPLDHVEGPGFPPGPTTVAGFAPKESGGIDWEGLG